MPEEYRARPLPEENRLQVVQPEQRVVVVAKNWLQSSTVIINGVLFALALIVQVLDIVFNANIIAPLVNVFTSDPEVVTRVLTVTTQIYTAINLVLRFRTIAPLTFNNEPKK